MTPLANSKHEAVAIAYLADPQKVGWRAYRQVYPKSSRRAAENGFSRLMKNDEFSARVAGLAEQAAQGAVMTAKEVLEELSKLARASMADYVGGDDIAVPIRSLTRDQAAAVQEHTVEHYTEGKGEDAREVRKVKFKLVDKLRALELLGKHHALFTERHVHEFGGVAERLAAALERIGDNPRQKATIPDKLRPLDDPPRRRNVRKTARLDGAAGDARTRARWAR
jgi:phage terminase small subunit